MRRSLLFLPGNTPNMLINGSCLGADAVIFDLEDAVSPAEKDAARILVRNTMTDMDFRGCETIVRINGIDTPYWQEDLDEVMPCRPNLILLPKTGTAADIQTADDYMTQVEQRLGLAPNTVGLVALIETALGVENAFAVASASPRVTALFLGAEDLTADLQCKRTKESREIEYARTRLVVAARAAGVDVYDTPFTSIEDMDGLLQDALTAKSLGFSGKAVIHPKHVDTVNRVFSPSEKEIHYAQEVFAAIEEAKKLGKGAISLHGKMIDAPIAQRARRVLEAMEEIAARRSGI